MTDAIDPKLLSGRREFIKKSMLTATGASVLSTLPLNISAHTVGKEEVKLGLIGCGGRGTGAAFETLKASPSVKLVAMGDVFQDKLEESYSNFSKVFGKDQLKVSKENKFVGFDAYQHVIEASDAIILATPPPFRPIHFEEAIRQGKHVFMEKPLAVDSPGYRQIMETGKLADEKNLNVVVGLQFRYRKAFQELVKRLQDGQIGDILSIDVYYNVGTATVFPRKPGQTEMEYQLRNWRYFGWLWGGQLAGQTIHQMDVVNWTMDDFPVTAKGLGGRLMLSGPDNGDIFDHHYAEFEYSNGTKMHVQSRQMEKCWNRMGIHFQGTQGSADERYRIFDRNNKVIWQYNDEGDLPATQVEQNIFIDSILNGKHINNTSYGAKSTMSTILGRMAIHSGQVIELRDAENSALGIIPDQFTWEARMPNEPDEHGNYRIPRPGYTEVL